MQDRRRVAGSEKGAEAADIIDNTPKQTKVMDLVHTRMLSLSVITAGGSSRCSSEPPVTRGEGSGKLHSARTCKHQEAAWMGGWVHHLLLLDVQRDSSFRGLLGAHRLLRGGCLLRGTVAAWR
eukprot:scaffold39355_cov64-Phaeocystis_antarctica.AAC.1